MTPDRTFLAVALCLAVLPACKRAETDPCAPGAVGKACIAGSLAFPAKTAVALEGPDFIGIVMSTDALDCQGAMTRASPGKAAEKVTRPSSRLELMVDLGTEKAQPGKRYTVAAAADDENAPKGTTAGLIGVPETGLPIKMIARSGWISFDEIGEQSIRGTFDLAFGVGKHTGTFEARYCTPVPPAPKAPAETAKP